MPNTAATAILPTTQTVSYSDLLLYAHFITLANTTYKSPEDSAEAPKHVATFVI